ncbi:hypothetical protein GVN16_15060 [Emticicia sp. CRIBPO]|uniref:hypothetical protein n=1 Tax=Emticicia sp. CRIBPO TaxID=2683258 RepID=UPI00141349E3|nr:hypothetical protein [Emticicia sp. CRIBPO]NBA87089.1 hypothetical protein [Emticicia sp. CRIBPO]
MQKKIVFILLLVLVVLIFFKEMFWPNYIVNILILLVGFPFSRIDRYFFKRLPLVILPILLGITGLLRFPFVDVIRDIYYFLIPVICIMMGYVLAKKFSLEEVISLFVLLGIIFSFLHTAISIQKFDFDLVNNFTLIRNEVSPGNSLMIISLFILLFNKRIGITIPYNGLVRYSAIAINIIALILSGSRTYLVIGIVFLFFMYFNAISFKKRIVIILITLIPLFAVISIGSFESYDEKTDRGGMTFMTKLIRSFTELETKDYSTQRDIIINFRGFESLMAISSFGEGTSLEKVFGKGFGAMVDLGMYVPLGNTEFRFIPILHNGFLYLLIKTGLSGILLYFFFFFYIFKDTTKVSLVFPGDSKVLFLERLVKASIASLIVANLVVSSFFNLEFEFLYVFLFVIYFKMIDYKMYGELF